jgi:ABC-type Na+ transport system ATPase subunit NatA
VPVIESVAAVLKTVEMLVEMKQQLGVSRSTQGYWQAIPPRERVKELAQMYGLSKLFPEEK